MMKTRYITASFASLVALATAGVGIANAASTNSNSPTNTTVGSSGIQRTVFRQQRLNAEAQVLNTTTADVQVARKNHTLHQLIKNAGLTRHSFMEKVKIQLTTDLEKLGYSQAQITLALHHRPIGHVQHHHHPES